MRSTLRIATLIATAVCLPIAHAAAAPATIDSIPQPDSRVFESEIAVDRDGSATIAWPAGPELRLVHRAPSGELSPIQVVASSEYLAGPDLALDRRGRGFVAWYDNGNGEVSVAPIGPAGAIGEPQVVGKGNDVDVEVDPSGNGTVLWRSREGLSAARLDADGSPKRVSTLSPQAPYELAFELDRRGTATVAAVGESRIRVLRVAPGTSMRAEVVLKRPAARLTVGEEPAVAVDPKGRSVVAWLAHRRGISTVSSALVEPSGSVRSVGDVTNGAQRNASFPVVTSNGSGWIVAWSSRTEKRRSNQIVFSKLARSGEPRRAQPLSGAEDAKQAALAAGRSTTVIWRSTSVGRGDAESCLAMRRITRNGKRGKLERIPGTCPASHGPVAGVAGGGGVVGSWTSAHRIGVLSIGSPRG